jgi:hypothetical protein
VTASISNSLTISSLPDISGTVIVTDVNAVLDGDGNIFGLDRDFPVSGSVTLGAGTAQIGSVTVGNTVTISGTVTANPTGTQTIAGTVTANGLAVGSTIANVFPIGVDTLFSGVRAVTDLGGYRLPISLGDSNAVVSASLYEPIPAGTNRIGTVTANTFAVQGTAVTTSNFTSTTASTVLANYNATREVLTIFNEGAGNLHICAGATCTTIAYQVRLAAGDYYEVPNHQTTITHSAVFATAGTARICEVS